MEIDIIDFVVFIVSSLVFTLLITVPTIRRIYSNRNLSQDQKNRYMALVVLIPIVGLPVYYARSKKKECRSNLFQDEGGV